MDFGDLGGVIFSCVRTGLVMFGGSVGDNGGGIMLEVFCGFVELICDTAEAIFDFDVILVV